MCLKMGAFDYLMKPLASDRVVTTMRKAMEVRDLRRENELLKGHILSGRLANPEAFSAFNTRNEVMLALFRYVESVAASPAPVLVTGETGVGKELAAQAIHRVSGRAGGYVSVNVAGLDEATFSDTLFGHKRGAFTGASEARGGLIEKAAGGTLFLDEIGDLTPALQTKLLRLLQEAEYLPLGADVAKRSDARIIVATNKPLNQLRDPAQFRPDLFFRLRHHHIHLPPLRERKGDLPMLVRQLVGQAAANMRMKAPAVPETVIRHLGTYDFPGNVRELAAMIQDAVAQSGGNALSVEVFQKWIGTGIAGKALPAGEPAGETEAGVVEFPEALPTLKAMSATLIAEAVRRADGNQAVAAKMLGISRQALNQRLNL
jgi:DNA-binding NtrC family response regulator